MNVIVSDRTTIITLLNIAREKFNLQIKILNGLKLQTKVCLC